MKEMKRILAIFLCLVMLVGVMPVSAFATEDLGGFFIPGGDKAASEDGSLGGFVIPGGKVEAEETTAPAEEETTAPSEEETTAPTEEETTAPTEEEEESEEETLTEEEVSDEAEQLAANETIYILAGGDFQEAGDHANSAENVTNILAQISQKYDTMDGFLFIGDYDCETHNSATETANGITALMSAVQGSYSNLNDANSVLVQGNHDYMDSRIDATGGHDFNGYAAYVLNEDDYPNNGGSQSGIQSLANNLKSWLNNKIGEGYEAPIFIVSHLPLAFTPRTVTQGDAKYAKYIFDVLNDAGKNGLNIIFLHGHDHAYGPDNYMGGEAIYLPVGDKICIAEAGSTSAWTEETLNFTYMNAGYTGYYSDAFTYVTTAGTDKLTMTVFAITDGQVTVERYSEDGLYNLKSAGYDGSYSNTSVTNVSLGLPKYSAVYASPQTITLTQSDASEMGTIGEWVGVSAAVTDDVTTSGNNWVTITESSGGTTTYAYTRADSITAGGEYVIVGNNHNVALQGTTSMGTQSVTISGTTMTSTTPLTEWTFSGNSSGTIYNGTRYLRYNNNAFSLSTSSTTFTITDNGSNFRIRSGNYSFYYNGSSWTRSGRNTAQYVRLFVRNEDGDVTVGGTPGLYGKLEGELTYNVTAGTSADDALAAVKAGIAIKYATAADYSDEAEYADDGDGMTWTLDPNYDPNVPGDYAVTIKYGNVVLGTAEVVVPASTIYYVAEGNGLYLVDMNTTADNALAAVKAGVTVYSATDTNGTGKTAISDSDVTWNWVDTYNGADSGPYTVEILYKGTSLGTVEVKVNVQYETGIETDWTYIGETEGSGGITYKRVENVNNLVSGEKYLIILDCSSQTAEDAFVIPTIVTTGSGGSQRKGPDVVTSNGITDNATITGDYDNYLWTLTKSGSGWKIGNGSQYINVTLNNTSNRGELSFTSSGEVLTIGTGSNNPADANSYSFAIRDSSNLYWQYNTSATLVYATEGDDYTSRFVFYGREESDATPGGSIYALIEGNTVYSVPQGTSATSALAKVKAGITGYTASDANGTGKTELADSDLTWKWKNTYNSNYTGSYWMEISYQGKVLGTVEVQVTPAVVNNYPSYPNEGAVKVGKTGTGIDFQSSGVAQVEVSASGVPSKKGADVIVMLDTSSSMRYCLNCKDSSGNPTAHSTYKCTNGGQTRAEALEDTLKNLIKQFKTPGADGELMDIDVAIGDFNGFNGYGGSSGTPYDRDEADHMNDTAYYPANGNNAKVYTGDNTVGLGAFIAAEDLSASYTLNYDSGTNYDYAFDAIYQMATTKKAANTEERDLYVIFMSDGAAMQWNYYHSQGASNLWENWITGQWDASDLTSSNLNCTTHAYYYDEVDHNGDGMRNEHRMANAVKGDPNELYEVIRKVDTLGTPTGEANMYMVPGLGAKLFSIAFAPTTDTNVEAEHMVKSIASLASEQTGTTQYFYNVSSAEALGDAFTAIGSEIAYAAYNARFVDQMGQDYDLQMSLHEYKSEGSNVVDASITPSIEILSYDIYTKAEADEVAEGTAGDTVTNAMIGTRKGTSKVLEKVTFNTDGTEAYSTLNSTGPNGTITAGENILIDGVIYANTFWYNSTASGVAITGVDIPTGLNADGTTSGSTNVLPAETFYWKMGTVQSTELAMRYYVYLTDSLDDPGKDAGSYPTNEYATLYYDNYLHNPCKKETVSPVLAWEAANVSYAFYLVNAEGQPVNMNGEVVPLAKRVVVVNPTLYKEIKLNNLENVNSLQVISSGVLPDGYALYDETSMYTVVVNSNSTGLWQITWDGNQWDDGDDNKVGTEDDAEVEKTTNKIKTTFVTNYNPDTMDATSFDTYEDSNSYDYTHTVVWFAVKWEPQALPDTVVIDYGLPVDIHVMANDMFGDYGKLVGVAAGNQMDNVIRDTNGVTTTSATGTFGSAKVQIPASGANASNSVVRYELKKDADLTMSDAEVFTYSVKYANTNYEQNNGYYYSTITVIPATTIYYEDDFVDLSSEKWENNGWVENGVSGWTPSKTSDATQDEDRPDDVNYAFDTVIDANNVYGYDSAYAECSTYSLDQAAKATVDYDNRAKASFTFWGTGFDVISATNSDTGTIIVDVTDAATGKSVHSYVVDTYYGYVMTENPAPKDEQYDKWTCELKKDASGLYQVPVIKVSGLPYGQYKIVITAQYSPAFDPDYDSNLSTEKNSYDFYLDAIRIYDPAGVVSGEDNDVIEDAYIKDNEASPVYQELRNNILNKSDVDSGIPGAVFIDGIGETASVENYKEYGPNNEVYLKPGQAILFTTNLGSAADKLASLQIGLKAETQTAATYYIFDAATVKASADLQNMKPATVLTATDMYYDITALAGKNIVIYNSGDGILSITNLKATFTEASGLTEILDIVDDADVENFLNALNDGETGTGSDSGTGTNLAEVIKSIVGRLKNLFGNKG